MRRILPAIFLTVLLLGPPRAPGQATQPGAEEQRQAARAEIEKEMGALPYLGEHDLSDVLSFTMRDGKIFPVTRLPVGDEGYVKITGLGGWTKVRVIGRETLHTADDEHYLQWNNRDLGAGTTIEVSTEVYSSPSVVNVSRETELPDDGMTSVQFIQSAGADKNAVALYIQTVYSEGRSPPARRISGASLADLAESNPAEVNQYLRPIFRMFGQEQVVFEVDSRTAYQVLSELYPIDPATAAAVSAAVNGMAADSYADREAAMKKLRDLGEPAAVDLMRSNPGHLSSEQTMRIELFLVPYLPLADDAARRLSVDVNFLLDCQFSRDPVIRDLAGRQYKNVTGKALALDTHLTGRALGDAVAALRP
jgi:hypothetical protein